MWTDLAGEGVQLASLYWLPLSSQKFPELLIFIINAILQWSFQEAVSWGEQVKSCLCLFYLRPLIKVKGPTVERWPWEWTHEPSRSPTDRWWSPLQLHHCDEPPSHVDHIGLNGDPFIGNVFHWVPDLSSRLQNGLLRLKHNLSWISSSIHMSFLWVLTPQHLLHHSLLFSTRKLKTLKIKIKSEWANSGVMTQKLFNDLLGSSKQGGV